MNNLNREELLDIAYLTFIGRTHLYDVFSDPKWSATGIEHWVQTELIVAFTDRGYDVTTIGKVARQCDLIVNNMGVELRSTTAPVPFWLIDAIEKHPEADLYLFLSKTSPDLEAELDRYFTQHGFISVKRMLKDDWMVMVVERTNANVKSHTHEKFV